MKATLCFQLVLPWQQTLFEPLKKIALNYHWAGGTGIWIFRIEDLKKIELVLGKTIEIEGYCGPFRKERVLVHGWKGDDMIQIIEMPKTFKIITHRKIETEIDGQIEYEIKEITHETDKALVESIWKEVIAHQPLNKRIKTRKIAENICKMLGITRFNRHTGTFSFEHFFGSRKDYGTYFYNPIKVLVWQGKVKHYKNGMVERLL